MMSGSQKFVMVISILNLIGGILLYLPRLISVRYSGNHRVYSCRWIPSGHPRLDHSACTDVLLRP